MNDTAEILSSFKKDMAKLTTHSYQRGGIDYAQSMLEAFKALDEAGVAEVFTVKDAIATLEGSIALLALELEGGDE